MPSEHDYILKHLGRCLEIRAEKLNIAFLIDHGSVPQLGRFARETASAEQMYRHIEKGMKRAYSNSRLIAGLSAGLPAGLRHDMQSMVRAIERIDKQFKEGLPEELIEMNEKMVVAARANDFNRLRELILSEEERIKSLDAIRAAKPAVSIARRLGLSMDPGSSGIGGLACLIATALEMEKGKIFSVKNEDSISTHVKSVASHIIGNRRNDLVKIEGCLYAVGRWLKAQGGKLAAEQQMRLSFGPYNQATPTEFFTDGRHTYSICMLQE